MLCPLFLTNLDPELQKTRSALSRFTGLKAHFSYPMDKLDNLVLKAFQQKIYTPDYVRTVIDNLRKFTNRNGGEDRLRIKKLETELSGR